MPADIHRSTVHSKLPLPTRRRQMTSSDTPSSSRCLTCVSRKVKCDGQAGTCARCQRLGLPCRWPEAPSVVRRNPNITAAGHPRLRTTAACQQCRQRKLKCDGARPCASCVRRSIACAPNPSVLPRASPETLVNRTSPVSNVTYQGLPLWIQSGQDPSDVSRMLPPDGVLRALMDKFFSFIHPVSCNNYLHHGSLFGSLKSRTNPHLLLALCSVSAKFSDDISNDLEQAERWANAAKAHLFTTFDTVSASNIAILQTLALREVHEGNFVPAWNLTCAAFRLVVQMKLHHPEALPETVSQARFMRHETHVRLAWSVYVLHCLLLGDETTSCEDQFRHLPLPCNPWNFSQSLRCTTFYLQDILDASKDPEKSRATNTCAYLIKIISLRGEVMRYNESLNSPGDHQLLPWQVDSKFHSLSETLEKFRQSLRDNLAFETRTLYNFRSSKQLDMFLMIHMWFHHCNCQLSALWIRNHPRASENAFSASAPSQFVSSCTVKSVFHAKQMSRLVEAALQLDAEHEFSDSWLALCMRDSIHVEVAALQMQENASENEGLAEYIKTNMNVLTKMKQRFGLASKTVSTHRSPYEYKT